MLLSIFVGHCFVVYDASHCLPGISWKTDLIVADDLHEGKSFFVVGLRFPAEAGNEVGADGDSGHDGPDVLH